MTGTAPAKQIPERKFVPPTKTVAAPPKAEIQPIAPVKIAAPIPPVVRTTHTAPVRQHHVAQARPPERVVPQHHQRVEPTRVEPTRVAIAPQRTPQHHQYQHRPQPHYNQRPQPQHYPQQKSSSGGGFLAGLVTGGAIGLIGRALLSNGSRPPSSSADYRGPATGTHQLGMGKPMHPAVFESLMNAAIEGRPDTRVRLNNGEEVPTTSEERMMFKQLTFNMLQRPDQPLDERLARTLVTPEALANRNIPDARAPGTHITHFSDEFGSRRLSELVDKNYTQLRDQYANEYQMHRSEMARQEPPRHQGGYGHQTSQKPLGFIKLFGA